MSPNCPRGQGPVSSRAYAHSHILVLHSGFPSSQAALGSKSWFSLTDTHMHAKDTCRAHVFLPQHRDCMAATCQVLQCAALPPHATAFHRSQPLCLGWGYSSHHAFTAYVTKRGSVSYPDHLGELLHLTSSWPPPHPTLGSVAEPLPTSCLVA